MKLKLAPLAALAVLAATPVLAQTLTPEDFIHRHMDFAAKGDAAAIANDFAVDGASISNGAASVGRAAIEAQFAKLVGRRPAPPAGGAGGPPPGGGGGGMGGMKVDKIWSQGNVGFIQWEAGPVHATEVFVIHDNKIASQSVFMSSGPPPAPKS